MKKIIPLLFLLSLPFQKAFAKELYLANVPVAGIYEEPDIKGSFETQEVYGHPIEVVERFDNEWVKVKSIDGCQGYSLLKELIKKEHALYWHDDEDEDIWRVKTLAAMIYPSKSVCQQPLIKIPYDSYVKVLDAQLTWSEVQLLNGEVGYTCTGNIERRYTLSLKEMLRRAHQFLGLPFVWGGKSSFGFDCSGFIAALVRQTGYPMLRTGQLQINDPNLIEVAYEDIQAGDFLYFHEQGNPEKISHVALSLGEKVIIHSCFLITAEKLLINDLDLLPFLKIRFSCARRLPASHRSSNIGKIVTSRDFLRRLIVAFK